MPMVGSSARRSLAVSAIDSGTIENRKMLSKQKINAVPTALIFCFDSIFLFSIVPLSMALTASERRALLPTIGMVAKEIVFHPLIVAAYCGALAAALHVQLPVALDSMLAFLQGAAAPVALFALGVTVALR